MDHRVKVPGVLISAVLLMIFQLRSAQGDGEYFNPFAAWNCQGEECRQVWGNSGLGEMNLEHVASQVVGNGAEVAFMQYSRSNDDTPAGEDPTEFLAQRVGKDQVKALLEKDDNFQFRQRQRIVDLLQSIVQEEPAFYEVFAQTYAIAVGSPLCSDRGCGRTVAFINILESTSGRYENSPEINEFHMESEFLGREASSYYKTYYRPGVGPKSEPKDKTGTLSVAVISQEFVADSANYTAKLRLESKWGKNFKECTLTFAVPLTGNTQILCERFKFPPLLRIRSNLEDAHLDSLRYRLPPHDAECLARENVGDSGMSDNALIGAYLRSSHTCIGCHAATPERPTPMGGDLLCPSREGDNEAHTTYGNPKNPNLMSHLILNYFLNPRLENVPKQSRRMQVALEKLKADYCAEHTFTMNDKPQALRKVMEAWVKNHDNPNKLEYEKVCLGR